MLKEFIEKELKGDMDKSQVTKELLTYSENIHKYNKRFNLTGHKTINEIVEDLIINSLRPIMNIIVPRGTIMADLGSGSGIPGVPFTIINKHLESNMLDSNSKKIRFINMLSRTLDNPRIKGTAGRIEELGHDPLFRNTYDIITSRAMSDIYTITELGAPLLRENGMLIMYTREKIEAENIYNDHFIELGLTILTDKEKNSYLNKVDNELIILKKTSPTPNKYPRRIPNINRALKASMDNE